MRDPEKKRQGKIRLRKYQRARRPFRLPLFFKAPYGLESKIDKLTIDVDELIGNLFTPLRNLFPAAEFSYILFTDKNSIYQKKYFSKRRQIKHFPLKLYERLKRENISTLFFGFNESRDDFERIKPPSSRNTGPSTSLGSPLKGKPRSPTRKSRSLTAAKRRTSSSSRTARRKFAGGQLTHKNIRK